jgi:cytochrome c biogenesis protein CcmG, thiol:disulfide interchange protein DsbE
MPTIELTAENFEASVRDHEILFVDFWASWCGPCRDEFPLLATAYTKYSGDGLQIVGVIHDDGPQTATDFARAYNATWPLVLDPNDSVYNAYRGFSVPTSYYIDKSGVVRAVSLGAPPPAYLDDEIQKLL